MLSIEYNRSDICSICPPDGRDGDDKLDAELYARQGAATRGETPAAPNYHLITTWLPRGSEPTLPHRGTTNQLQYNNNINWYNLCATALADPGGPGPPAPKIFSKVMQFSGNFEQIEGSGPSLGSKLRWAPLTKIMDQPCTDTTAKSGFGSRILVKGQTLKSKRVPPPWETKRQRRFADN